MGDKIKFKTVFMAWALVMLLAQTTFAHGAGNGGDGIAIEATSLASSLERYLEVAQNASLFKEVNVGAFKSLVGSVVFLSTENALRDQKGHLKDAINLKANPPTVILSRTRCKDLDTAEFRKLVFHELLSLLNLEHTDYYAISSRLEESQVAMFDKSLPPNGNNGGGVVVPLPETQLGTLTLVGQPLNETQGAILIMLCQTDSNNNVVWHGCDEEQSQQTKNLGNISLPSGTYAVEVGGVETYVQIRTKQVTAVKLNSISVPTSVTDDWWVEIALDLYDAGMQDAYLKDNFTSGYWSAAPGWANTQYPIYCQNPQPQDVNACKAMFSSNYKDLRDNYIQFSADGGVHIWHFAGDKWGNGFNETPPRPASVTDNLVPSGNIQDGAGGTVAPVALLPGVYQIIFTNKTTQEYRIQRGVVVK